MAGTHPLRRVDQARECLLWDTMRHSLSRLRRNIVSLKHRGNLLAGLGIATALLGLVPGCSS